MNAPVAIELVGVGRDFTRRRSTPFGRPSTVAALSDISLDIPRGARFGIVGESGSGKSTLLRLIAGLDQPTTGSVTVAGLDISRLRESQLGGLRRNLQIVFQDPMGSLDPRMRVRDIVAEPLEVQGRTGIDAAVALALEQVGLPVEAGRRYPHQFSGGQRQRISIARAIAPDPRILLADEAVSALDVTVRAQILALLETVARERELTLVFVSHDLAVVRRVCDQVAVLRNGVLVETGSTAQIYTDPQDPYTRELLGAAPTLARSLAAARARAAGAGRARSGT